MRHQIPKAEALIDLRLFLFLEKIKVLPGNLKSTGAYTALFVYVGLLQRGATTTLLTITNT